MNQTTPNPAFQEIDLKELLYAVLRKWRAILLTAFILAVFIGGYKTFSGFSSANDKVNNQKTIEEYETKLATYQLQNEASAKQLASAQHLLESETERMDSSPLMKLDPLKAVRMSYGLEVSLSDGFRLPGIQEDNTALMQRIVNAYVAKLSDEMMEEAAGQLDMDAADLASITSIQGDEYSHKIQIDAYANTKEEALNILNAFTGVLQEDQAAMSAEYGAHTIAQTSERLYQDANQEIMTRQLQQINSVTDLKTKLTELQTAMSEAEKNKPAPPAVSKSAILKGGVKYGILGFVLGGFLSVFFICIAYLMSDKTVCLRDITRRYGLKGLGEFSDRNVQKKMLLSGIDRWIDRLFGHGRQPEANEVYQIIMANVKNYMPEQTKKILITGSASEEKCRMIEKHLNDTISGIGFEAAAELTSDYKTLEKLPGCDAVILVEERGRSTSNMLEAELTIIKNMEKQIVGVILY